MAKHTLVVEFDGDGQAYAAGETVLGGRLVAVDFGGDRLAVAEELLAALDMARALLVDIEEYSVDGASIRVIDAAIAKATQ